jgi:hypothetical protein
MSVWMSETLAEIVPALVKAKAAFLPAVRDSENPHFRSKFVSLEGVHKAVDEALLANGLVVVQPTRVGEDGRAVLITRLMHSSGEWLAGEYPVTASQAGPQGEGSGMTYARRYALMAMMGIAPEDDDGEAATSRQAKPKAAAKPVDFDRLIADASNADQLAGVGAAIAAADMDAAARSRLRGTFATRMAEVRG